MLTRAYALSGSCQLAATNRRPPTSPEGSASPDPVTPCGIQPLVVSSVVSQQNPDGLYAGSRYVWWQSGQLPVCPGEAVPTTVDRLTRWILGSASSRVISASVGPNVPAGSSANPPGSTCANTATAGATAPAGTGTPAPARTSAPVARNTRDSGIRVHPSFVHPACTARSSPCPATVPTPAGSAAGERARGRQQRGAVGYGVEE